MRLGTKAWLAGLSLGMGLLAHDRYQRRKRLEASNVLSGKVALVTGGSRGLGLLLARELAREGCRVAICARDERELERAKFELSRKGIAVMTAVCDVGDRAQVEELVANVRDKLGPIEVLVNNAGIIAVGPIATMTIPDFQNALDVMFWGTVYATMAALPQMLERGEGRIINITSIGGRVSVPHLAPYCSAKFAAIGFSQGLGTELSRRAIKVTTVVPGLMRTGSHVNALFKGHQNAEYKWFGLSASLPFLSMDAEKAAREIVLASKRGDAQYTVGFPARILARFAGLFPGASREVLSLVNRFLPGADSQDPQMLRKGFELEREGEPLLWSLLTGLGRKASRRHQEYRRPFYS